jgi:hypothetical protein
MHTRGEAESDTDSALDAVLSLKISSSMAGVARWNTCAATWRLSCAEAACPPDSGSAPTNDGLRTR